MKIRTRILLIVVVLIALMFVAQAYVSRTLKSLGSEIYEIANLNIPATEIITKIANLQLKQSYNFERVLRFASLGTSTSNNQINSQIDEIPINEAKAQFEKINKDIKESFLALNQDFFNSDIKLYNLLQIHKEKIISSYGKYELSANKIVSLINEKKYEKAKELLFTQPLEIEESDLRLKIEVALSDIQSNVKERAKRADTSYKKAIEKLLFITFITLVIGLLLTFLIARSITVPLSVAVDVSEKIGRGEKDFVFPKNQHGEIGILIKALADMSGSLNLSEMKLEERAEELARSNKELEQFAYVASHDLQEPLRMVASYVQLLAKKYKGKLDSDADEFIEFAVDGSIRMKNLINDLLEYSRVGRREVKKISVNTEVVLKKTLQNLKETLAEKNSRITHGPLPSVLGDETQLIQLFQNLIGNGIKFCKEDVPTIHISVKKEIDPKGVWHWRFSFKDNGIGIEQGSIDRIFQIFQRLHTRKEYSGTGIGLSICKKIVERHGGTLFVESRVGVGSDFIFTLPFG